MICDGQESKRNHLRKTQTSFDTVKFCKYRLDPELSVTKSLTDISLPRTRPTSIANTSHEPCQPASRAEECQRSTQRACVSRSISQIQFSSAGTHTHMGTRRGQEVTAGATSRLLSGGGVPGPDEVRGGTGGLSAACHLTLAGQRRDSVCNSASQADSGVHMDAIVDRPHTQGDGAAGCLAPRCLPTACSRLHGQIVSPACRYMQSSYSCSSLLTRDRRVWSASNIDAIHLACSNMKSRGFDRTRTGAFRLRRNYSDPDLPLRKLFQLKTDTSAVDEHESARQCLSVTHRGFGDDLSQSFADSPQLAKPKISKQKSSVCLVAEAVCDHIGIEEDELSFAAGDLVEVTDSSHSLWWHGRVGAACGWFAANFVRLRVAQNGVASQVDPSPLVNNPSSGAAVSCTAQLSSGVCVSNSDVRSLVIAEILSSEQNYITCMSHVIQGYLYHARLRTDLFTSQQIEHIFGNIEQLHSLHTDLYAALQAEITQNGAENARVGRVFIDMLPRFSVYTQYCANYIASSATLQRLSSDISYQLFFEACRLMMQMMDISLVGVLLTPVQKICRYPLQLAELCKHTTAEHADLGASRHALEAVRQLVHAVNESNRRAETVQTLDSWQSRVAGWEGPNLIATSTQMLLNTEALRVTHTRRQRDSCHLYLFDKLIVYCRKDLLKREVLQYRGRIDLSRENIALINMGNTKDAKNGYNMQNSIKIVLIDTKKWFMFGFKTKDEKTIWFEKIRDEIGNSSSTADAANTSTAGPHQSTPAVTAAPADTDSAATYTRDTAQHTVCMSRDSHVTDVDTPTDHGETNCVWPLAADEDCDETGTGRRDEAVVLRKSGSSATSSAATKLRDTKSWLGGWFPFKRALNQSQHSV